MTYSQKYSIVQFTEPVDEQYQFSMDEWPLHITLADVFAIELSTSFIDELTTFLSAESPCKATAGDMSTLGTGDQAVPVTLINNTTQLQSLHDKLVSFLENHGAVFNSPQFTRAGFLPHVTHQNHARPSTDQSITFRELSLIDMFVDGDWQKRKVLKNFKLCS